MSTLSSFDRYRSPNLIGLSPSGNRIAKTVSFGSFLSANFLDWKKQTSGFDALGAIQQFQNRNFNLASDEMPENVKGVHLSPGCFKVLGVQPAVGRAFTNDEAQTGSAPVVILGHDLWVSRFASDPHALGRDIRLNGETRKVIGIMPAGFELPLTRAQIYLPLEWTAAERHERRIANYLVLGRLKHGVRHEAAAAQLDTFSRLLEREHPESNKDVGVLIQPL